MKNFDFELLFTICIPVLVVVGIMCLIMAAPSLDEILRNY